MTTSGFDRALARYHCGSHHCRHLCLCEMITPSRTSEGAVSEVLERMVGDTGIEPVASSV